MEVTEDSIAVVGVGGRFPGARDVDQFWRVLLNKENHVKDIPPDRWNNDAFYDVNPDVPGKSYVKKAGLLDDHDLFDNRLFGINDIEAERMDPQQHYILECTHMALENAGITRAMMAGSRTGVYIGAMNRDYCGEGVHDVYQASTNYTVTGVSASILAARVSYVYDLRGPSMVVDTACSSSLVALHLAAQAIAAGECDMAICGGVSSILLPDLFIVMSRARLMSATGQSQAFSQTADGYARSEGCGVVILKRLGQAVRDGDHIWGVVGTLCNQDGRTATPITAPSGVQQVNLLREVYSKFKVNPRDVTYIEAHGTGTPVGDPIEVNALGQFFGSTDRPPLPIGSVKTNIGHLESAAGIAGLIKVLLMIRHQKYVPTVLFSDMNPRLDFAGYGFQVCRDVSDWKVSPSQPRVASVNSFGFGGTNSHAIVQEYMPGTAEKRSLAAEPLVESRMKTSTRSHAEVKKADSRTQKRTATNHEAPPPGGSSQAPQVTETSSREKNGEPEMIAKKYVVVLSAPSRETLIKTVEDVFEKLDGVPIEDLSYTSTHRRDLHSFRLAAFASNTEELLQMKDHLVENAQRAIDTHRTKTRLIFLFCGVGTTWKGMCKSLMQTSRAFRTMVDLVDERLRSLDDTFSIKALLETGKDISDPLHAHLAIFTSQIALLELWKKFGAHPDAIVGQSVGEVAAAYCAGILNLENAVRVIYHRSKCLREASGGKMMVITNCPVEEVEAQCAALKYKASIAVFSSSKACTVSGDADALEDLKGRIQRGTKDPELSKPRFVDLHVQCAYHSHHVEKAATELLQKLQGLQGNKSVIPVVSTVTGKLAEEDEFSTASYWQRNTRDPVQLYKAMTAAAKICQMDDNTPVVVLELGPRPVLKAHLKDIFADPQVTSLPSMLPDKEAEAFTKSIRDLFQMGVNLKIKECHEHPGNLISIPRYPFNRVKALFHSKATRDFLQGKTSDSQRNSGHPFVSRNGVDSSDFSFNISPTSTPFVYDHVVNGTIVVQGATFGEVGLAVGQMIWDLPAHLLEVQLTYDRVIMLKPDESIVATVSTHSRDKEDSIDFVVRTKAVTHARGTIRKSLSENTVSPPHLRAIQARCTRQMDENKIYEEVNKAVSIEFGKTTRILKSARYNENETLVEVSFAPEIQDQLWKTALHPCLLDAVAQASVILPVKIPATAFQFWLPAGIDKVVVHRHPEPQMLIYLRSGKQTAAKRHYDGLFLTRSGEVVAEVVGMRLESKTSKGAGMSENSEYASVWKELFMETVPPRQNRVYDFLLIGLDDASMDKCKAALNGHRLLAYTSVDKLVEDLRNFPKEQLLKISAIVFCSPCSVDLREPQRATKTMQAMCWMMIALVQHLSRMKLEIRLCVVTYNCQVLDQTRLPDIPVEPAGSVLWGVVRSVNMDFAYDGLHLVDLTEGSQPEVQLLRALLCGETSPSLDTLSEVKVHGKHAFGCEFNTRERSEETPHKLLFNSGTLPLQVLGTNANPASDFVCRIMATDPAESTDGMVKIHVQRAFLHDSDVYPRTQAATEWFPRSGRTFHKVKVFEVVGVVTRTGRRSRHVCVGDTVVALYPMGLATVVSVPAKSVMKLESPKDYKLGSALEAYLLSTLAKDLRGRQKTVVLHSQERVQLASTLHQQLRQQGRHVECVEVTRRTAVLNAAEELVLLVETDTEILQNVLPEMPCLKHVVSPRHLITSQARAFLQCTFPNVDISEVDFQAELHPTKLSQAASKFKSQFASQLTQGADASTAECFDRRELTSDPQRTAILNVEAMSKTATHVLPAASTEVLLETGAYIVTGGHSGLGWEMAKMLAEGGAGMVVCLSRSKPSEDLKKEMKDITSRCKCQMVSSQCDVSDLHSVQTMMRELKGQMKDRFQLRGVFHCAAVFDDALVIRMTEEKLANVLQPKVLGTLNLHLCTKEMPLDFFVVSSSVAAIIGNSGQTGYSAANCFQDAIMFLRQQQGLAGQTINWGPLNLGVLVKDQQAKDKLAKQGWKCLEVEDIRESLFQALRENRIQSIFCITDGEKLLKFFQAHIGRNHFSQKFKTVMAEMVLSDMSSSKLDENPLLNMLPDGLPGVQRRPALEAVKMAMGEIFMLDDVSMGTKFTELGIDSMLVLAFLDRISDLAGVLVPIGMLFDEATTVGNIVDYLRNKETENGSVNTKSRLTNGNAANLTQAPGKVEAKNPSKTVLSNDLKQAQKLAQSMPSLASEFTTSLRRDSQVQENGQNRRAQSQNHLAASRTSLVASEQGNVSQQVRSRGWRTGRTKKVKVCQIM